MPSDPGRLHIRNQRYPRWFDMLFGMLVALVAFGTVAAFFTPSPRLPALIILGGLLGIGLIILYGLFQMWDLRRPVTSNLATARTLFDWLVLGIRRKELGPADGSTALTAIRPLLRSRYVIHHLNLAEDVEVDNLIVRYRTRAVTRVRFAPDPNEDYAGAEHPCQMCQATLEMDSGKSFHLFVNESDALRLRQWAVAKGIAVCDCDGYQPRAVEPAA
jgi:hypothetical protein